MSYISLLALEYIKREAKKLKTQHPDLSHGQRLDIASRETLKVRNYHEANIRCKKSIQAQINQNGSLAECNYCQFSFVTTEEDDLKAHELWHLEYEKVERALGFLPASYKEREKEKKEAYTKLNSNNSFTEKMDGALRLIHAHFDRSLEHAIIGGYWRKHPTFDKYLAMVDYTNIISSEVMRKIEEEHGKILGQIEIGKSYWFPS